MTNLDNLRLEIYRVLKEQGLLNTDAVRFSIEKDSKNLERILEDSEPFVVTINSIE